MKAVTYTKYGAPSVLQIEEIAKPAPRKNEVLVRVYATTVTPSDMLLRSGKFPILFWLPARILYGITNPRRLIPGYELAGEVVAVGKDVTRFRKGDQVFGGTAWKMSCSAEYICLPEEGMITIKPANMTYQEAAAFCDGACTALHFLRKANIQPGKKVLINGASGSVGTFAVQLGKHFGAEVTGVCSTTNLELVRSLGADQVIDYTRADFAKSGQAWDIIFDAIGKSSFPHCKPALKPDGIYLTTAINPAIIPYMLWTSLAGGKRARTAMSIVNPEDLDFLKGIIAAGKIKSVIDRCYPLEQIAEAHQYVEKGRKKGNVVITVTPNGSASPLSVESSIAEKHP